MRLTTTILILSCLHLCINGYGQERISLSEKNASLQTVFQDIQKQTSYSIWYEKSQLPASTLINIELKDVTLEEAIDRCCKDHNLEYSFAGNMVVIKPKNQKKGGNQSGKFILKGKVTNEKAEPLEGAAIFIRGTHIGTQSDIKGQFELSSDTRSADIEISFTGYQTKHISLQEGQVVSISLAISVNPLDQIQVIAYGTTTKRLNTGDVSTVTGKTISEQPVSNPLAALEGRVSGLDITQNTGLASGNFTVRIRGQNSIANGNEPLYVIDGVPFTSTSIGSFLSAGLGGGNPLSSFSPADIESVEVLKDADATAIYGSRGANGVILITTKKGVVGTTRTNLNVYTGSGVVPHMMPLLNTPQYLQMRNEAFLNDGTQPDPNSDYDLTAWDTTRYTDWQKQFIGGTSRITDAQLTLSGGSKNTQFLAGGGFRNESTVFPGDFGNKKANTHLNIVHQTEDAKFQMSITGGYSVENNNLPQYDLTNQAITLPPDAPALYDSAGKLNWANNTFSNPYGAFLMQPYSNSTSNLIGSANFQYQFLPYILARVALGYTNLQMSETQKLPVSSFPPSYGITSGYTYFSNSGITSTSIEPQLEYKGKISQGKLDFLLGMTFQENKSQSQVILGSGYTSDALVGNISGAGELTLQSSGYNQYKYNAVFGRINYNWRDKYILNFTGRRDGSSRFGPGNQFGTFGAIGGAWIFTEEPFIKGISNFMSFGKIRMSYGTTGNDQIPDYQFLSTYSTTTYPYQGGVGLIPSRLYNPDFAWEINKKFEVGAEFAFWQNRLFLSGDYYQNRSSNQLVGYPLPYITGFASVQSNLPALVQNTGWEFQASSTNIKTSHFEWISSFNISFPKNILLSFPNIEATTYAQTYVVGKPLYIKMTLPYAGINASTGLYEFYDKKNTATSSPLIPNDLQPAAVLQKQFYGGLNNTFRFYGFEVTIFFQFVKQTGYNYFYGGNLLSAPGMYGNQPTYVLNRWQKTGDIASVQRFTQTYGDAYSTYNNASLFGSNMICDASFIRLKNLYISYQIPNTIIEKIHLRNGKVYLQGQNLFTITSYPGLDPEVQLLTALPTLRILTAGIQLTF